MEKINFVELSNIYSKISKYEPKYRFDKSISSLVGFSLTEFLLNNERAKLKQCQTCDKFFIASKNDGRIIFCPDCSRKSSKPKAKHAEYMRKWRHKQKKEKLEANITHFINKLGCTREEAIELITTVDPSA
jgi:hypothetical protein